MEEQNTLKIHPRGSEDIFKDIVGQSSAKLAIYDWYLNESQPLFIYGKSGYGKSNFAEKLKAIKIDTTQIKNNSNSMNTILKIIKYSDDNDILFFDEIHTLPSKIIEGLYNIIDKNSYYDPELCMDITLPKVRYIFASNLINKLPEAFMNRCKIIYLSDYSENELMEIVHKRYGLTDESVLKTIVRASKGIPRTALSLAQSIISGCATENTSDINDIDINDIDTNDIDNILNSRFNINPETGLNHNEFKIISAVLNRGRLSTVAVANLIGCSVHDAKLLYIEPLRASNWLAVSSQGVIPGVLSHKNYRLFMKKE